MTAGISAYLANAWLNMLAGTAFTAPVASYVQPHTGDPGAAGTANTIAAVPRLAVTWAAASGGVVTASNTPTWASWSYTSPSVITHLSLWDALTTGNFLDSFPVTAQQIVVTGNNLAVTPLTILLAPTAA